MPRERAGSTREAGWILGYETCLSQIIGKGPTQLAGYVESIAGTDDALLTSVGIETKTSRCAPHPPNALQRLSATAGEHEGSPLVGRNWELAGLSLELVDNAL